MSTINIPEADVISLEDFQAGDPIQVRAEVSVEEAPDLGKGSSINVSHFNMEATAATIVSDPIEISDDTEANKKIFSFIVKKSG
jgi:hypothetical protein